MFDAFPTRLREELDALARRYGTPIVKTVDLDVVSFDPLQREDRRIGEVCFVVRHNGAFLSGIKTFYPAGAYRLLTGGIDEGESIEHALRREVREETGLDVEARRFLAAIAYRHASRYVFSTFAFLLDARDGEPHSSDPHEQLAAFGTIAPSELEGVARTLEALPDGRDPAIGGSWREWGRFRAVVHRAVAEALAPDPPRT